MKDLRQALKPHVERLIAEGLEKAAAPFSPESLRATLVDMAKLGVSEFRVTPLLAVDVRGTTTAQDGIRYLEREKFTHRWDCVPKPVDERRNPGRVSGDFYELIVRI